MSEQSTLLANDDSGVRTLTLNRPEKRNALDTALIESLLAVLKAADDDSSIGAVVLTGAGVAFSAGADLGEFRDAGENMLALREHRTELLLQLQLRFSQIAKPVIAAVNGAALGAGAAIAIAADMVVISADAKLGYPETRNGTIPTLMIGTLVRNAGRKAAFELLATGELIDAGRAAVLGLVNRVVPPDQVLAEAQRLAAGMAALNRDVMTGTKRLFHECADLALADALHHGLAGGKSRKS
jgi:enoyl-CoA hydratase/carnithine racemase